MNAQTNKRAATRFLSGLAVTAHHQGLDHECEAVNLSRTGALLSGPLPGSLGKTLLITIASAAEDLRIKIDCEVTHREPGEEGHSKIGLRFRDLSLDERKQLEALIARVVECSSPAPLSRLTGGSTAQEIAHALESMPIAHRMLEAGRAAIQERGYLMKDSNPQVLEALSRNPQLTAAEAVALARNPTVLPSTLALLARNERFRNNEELRVLLATHPRAGFELVKQIIGTLRPPAAQKVLAHSSLDQSLKARLRGS